MVDGAFNLNQLGNMFMNVLCGINFLEWNHKRFPYLNIVDWSFN